MHALSTMVLPLALMAQGSAPAAVGTVADERARPTIAGLVAKSGGTFDHRPGDFDILFTAVKAAGLADALANRDAELTLFAPNDAAFIRLARDLGFKGFSEEGAWTFLVGALTDLGDGDPIPVLTQVLLYHVAPESLSFGDVFRIDLSNGTITTLQGGTITPDRGRLIDAEPDLRDPFLTLPLNWRASNGFIHAIDRVLLPVDL